MRLRFLALLSVMLLTLGIIVPSLFLAGPALADTWSQVASQGFTGDFEVAQPVVKSMAFYNPGPGYRLYAGTRNDDGGCRVYEYDMTNWRQVNDDGFGNIANTEALSMTVNNDRLYVGTRNEATGCEVWEYDGGSWNRVNLFGGFGDGNNVAASALAVYGGNLYAGTQNDPAQGGDGCEVWRYSGLLWTQINVSGFGYDNNVRISSMMTYGGTMYAGTENPGTGCHAWRYNGSSWTGVVSPEGGAQIGAGFGSPSNRTLSSMAIFSGRLYCGTRNESPSGCNVFSTDGTNWSADVTDGFGDSSNIEASSMAVYNDSGSKLYVGTSKPWSNGCQVWRYDGVSPWAQEAANGFGDPLNRGATAAAARDDRGLFFGTENNPSDSTTDRGTGCEVWGYQSGGSWGQKNQNGFSASNNYMVSSMAVLNGSVFAGTGSGTGCEVWRRDGGPGWTLSSLPSFGVPDNSLAASMAVYDDGTGPGPRLYTGTFNPSGCQVWRFDGPDPDDWTRVSTPGDIEGGGNRSACSMQAYDDGSGTKLYVGTYNGGGCEVWVYDGSVPSWTRLVGSGAPVGPGFNNSNNQRAISMAQQGDLFVGATNWSQGSEVWRYNAGAGWTPFAGSQSGFGNPHNQDALSMAMFNGRLYVGTTNWQDGCAVARNDLSPGASWEQVIDDGFGNTDNDSASSMAVLEGRLCVGTGDGPCQVWSSWSGNPDDWYQINDDSFGNQGDSAIYAMAARNEGLGQTLYAGVLNYSAGASVEATEPSIDGCDPGNGVQGQTLDVTIYGSNTHFQPGVSRAEFSGDGITVNSTTVVYQTEAHASITISDTAPIGPRDVNVVTPGENPLAYAGGFFVTLPGIPQIASASPAAGMQTRTLDVDIVGQNTHFVDGQSVATFSGGGITVNSTTVTDVHHATANITISGGAPAGPGNVNVVTGVETPIPLANGFTVEYAPAHAWYLAEGCTSGGIRTWVLVQNPNDAPADVTLTYMTANGAVNGPTATLAANSRASFDVGATVADQDQVSTMVTANQAVIAERSVYGPEKAWATDSIGVTNPSTVCYLPEGSAGNGFETWILVQNPNNQAAQVSLTYMTPAGKVDGPSVSLAANSRMSFKANNTVPGEYEVSTMVTADIPVVSERAMYGNGRTWAHDSIGVAEASTTWYLAEGSTGEGFETWVLVQNPGEKEATATLTFMTDAGKVDGPVLTLKPSSRQTVNVGACLPSTWNVSTMVTSNEPVIAERAMYGNGRAWGHDSIGVCQPVKEINLAEGCTGEGYETWVLVQNPNDSEAKVDVTFMTGAGEVAGPSEVMPANSRRTINVSLYVPNEWQVSTRVTCDKPVMAERAMYGAGRTWATDSIGYCR